MVDARHIPVARLEHHVDGPAAELDEAEAEAHLVELLPGGSRLEPMRALAAPAVPADQLEAELAEVAGLEEPDFARHEVVVEQLHRAASWYRRRTEDSAPAWGSTPHHVPDTATAAAEPVLRVPVLRDARDARAERGARRLPARLGRGLHHHGRLRPRRLARVHDCHRVPRRRLHDRPWDREGRQGLREPLAASSRPRILAATSNGRTVLVARARATAYGFGPCVERPRADGCRHRRASRARPRRRRG